MRPALALVVASLLSPGLAAQSVEQLIATGDSLDRLLRPDSALVWYERAVAMDSSGSRQLWKTGHALVDIAKQMTDESKSGRALRDSLYWAGAQYGWRAIAANDGDPDGHFVVALALGRLALGKGGRERVRYGNWIHFEATRTLARAPDHDGAHHVLGAFHAEVQRLSPVSRFFARMLFGASLLANTSWDSAQVHLERAIAIDPAYLFHRLELAEVLIDRKQYAAARQQLEAIQPLPPTSDVLDRVYQKQAEELLRTIERKGR